MKIKPKQYARSLFEALGDSNKKESEKIIKSFAEVLIANNDISQLRKILDYFGNLWNKENNIVKVQIESAHKLDASVMTLLKNYIKEASNAKEIELEEKVDKSLLGGFVLRYNDKIFDNSLKSRVNDFRETIKR